MFFIVAQRFAPSRECFSCTLSSQKPLFEANVRIPRGLDRSKARKQALPGRFPRSKTSRRKETTASDPARGRTSQLSRMKANHTLQHKSSRQSIERTNWGNSWQWKGRLSFPSSALRRADAPRQGGLCACPRGRPKPFLAGNLQGETLKVLCNITSDLRSFRPTRDPFCARIPAV